MPSVGMRRTTRVFGARVLRSGRRLFSGPVVFKHMRRAPLAAANVGDDWIELLDNGGGGGGGECKENGWRNSDDDAMINLGRSREVCSVKVVDCDGHGRSLTENRRWGLVYSRKRTRSESIGCGDLDKKFGKKFSRKQSGKNDVADVSPSSVLIPDVNTTETLLSLKSKKRKVMRVSVSKSTRLRNRVSVHHGIQKRRSSLRSSKLRNPSNFGNFKFDFPMKSNPVISNPIQKTSIKELKELTQDIDSASCNASILVIESDRCHREIGAVITMEMIGPKQWFLVVKKNGVERFRVKALNVMRPCFCNRVTHAIIWAGGDESWRLEFPNRQDWFVFKELYRRCSERTVRVQSSVASIIPVPRVNEVSNYADEKYVPFKMPDLYISMGGDEVSRTLEKSDPVYDMDSDDDEWLNKFNDGCESCDTRVDEDIFEKVIDAFERGFYCTPDDYSDVTTVVDRCSTLASKDVLEAVFAYWFAKRKKHSALIRVFQLYKPKRFEQLNFKSVLRKKRSFRQRGTQAGRGKQLTFLKAALYEKTLTAATEAENTATKVEETEAAANWAEQAAVVKRQRAQRLMKVADLLTYKAAMSVKIAESRATSDHTIDELF
ncbi:putative enhancer of polycomb protein [Helianthus anomalus]